MGNTIKDFVEEFAAFWMPPFEDLKHVCQPNVHDYTPIYPIFYF
jgi:hypothetical protein